MKTREKILRKPDITLDEMTVLIAELEAMDIVNNTLKLDTPKVPHGFRTKLTAWGAGSAVQITGGRIVMLTDQQ